MGAGQAQALVVTVNGQTWNVTTFGPQTFISDQSKFATPANGGKMPWWNNSSLAQSFATAVGGALGYPNAAFSTNFGPLFSWSVNQSPCINGGCLQQSWAYTQGTGALDNRFTSPNSSRIWAQAEVPGPLPALGVAAAFGFSRKLRKRITASKVIGAPTSAG